MRTPGCFAMALVVVGALAGCRGSSGPSPAPANGGLLAIDRLLEIRHPSSPTWSPDGGTLAFVWEVSGVQNLWLIDSLPTRPSAPRQATPFVDGDVDRPFWSRDGRTIYFVHGGDLWQVPADGAHPAAAVWATPTFENQAVPSPDGTQVAFVRGGSSGAPDWQRIEGDLWIRSLADGRERQLTQGIGVVSSPSWSPDGARLGFAVSEAVQRADAPHYSGAKILYARVDHGPSTPAFVAATGGRVTTLTPSPGWDASPTWLDASRLVYQRLADDNRTREFIVGDPASGRTRVIHREVDPKFWSLSFVAADIAASPDGRWLAFVSDKDGWDHLYVVPTAGGEAMQVTRGRYEVRNVSWAPDSRHLAFDHSLEDKPGVRHLAVGTFDATTRQAQVADLTVGRGTNIAATWAPAGGTVVYQHTDPWMSPELFLGGVAPAGTARRLTDSMPDGVDPGAFIEPKLVSYKAPDGRDVPAYLFVPKGLDRTRKHPAIVWIHGDGINQNYDGWHVQRNYAVYYGFHQYLLQRGYVVLAPDYRGSIGYGRDWRQEVVFDVGGNDAEDAASSAGYLKSLTFVDPDRIDVWGLSYGGFFTLIAMADHPTVFRCGIDVAGSVDYRMWYEDPGGAWVVARMGTPETRPDVYDKAAVIDRVGKITRPLLILHGTADGNVPYLESVRLLDVMLKAGKDVDFMMYPGEFHYFQRAHVLRDAWTRSAAFFDKHLKAR